MPPQQYKTPLNGIWRIMPSMPLTEIIAQSGFGMQILDCEHGTYDYKTLGEDITACQLNNCLAYVRVSGLNKVEVQRCLDLGADGIVFPQLVTYEDFKLATSMMKYAPDGIRGFNPFVRASGYGVNSDTTNASCMVIIETLEAVNDLDNILSLNDIDMIYIGSYDLSAQLNCIGQMDAPQLVSVVEQIITKCKQASKLVGLMVNSKEAYKAYQFKGVDIFIHGVDSFKLKTMFTFTINNLNTI